MNNNYKKTCEKCNKEFNFRFFVYMDEGKMYMLNYCIKCHKDRKKCSKCLHMRPYKDFLTKSQTAKDGLYPYCLKCRKVDSAERYLKKTLNRDI